jgi:hypothetical protein
MSTNQALPSSELVPGLLVRHLVCKEWGLGKIVHLDDSRVHVFFKNIEGLPKQAVKSLSLANHNLAKAPETADIALDNLPPMTRNGKLDPPAFRRLTEDQAVNMFVADYRSFEDREYLERERNYKWAAHERIVAELLSATGRQLVARGNGADVATVLRGLLHATNLLATQELIALNDALKDSAAACKWANAAIRFIDEGDEPAFESLVDATERLPKAGNARVLTWPVVTLLPFLGNPRKLMFLKPTATKNVAETFCFDLMYDATPRWQTYARLLQLSDHLLNRLRPLGARDFIDVQSFSWIVAGSPLGKGRKGNAAS